MKPRDAKFRPLRLDKRLPRRFILTVMLSVFVFLAQAFPTTAAHQSVSDAGWVEICGDGGSYFIQLGDDGEIPEQECVHCDLCVVSNGETQVGISAGCSNTAQSETTHTSDLSTGSTHVETPEQFWPATRGPPLTNMDRTCA